MRTLIVNTTHSSITRTLHRTASMYLSAGVASFTRAYGRSVHKSSQNDTDQSLTYGDPSSAIIDLFPSQQKASSTNGGHRLKLVCSGFPLWC